ncbi:ferric reductase-like transmembrane domain-containing protein [Uliginosibacterium sp. sgz301328]|uniref:ferredoxin reductase family protein n=1 Tax=Uliginosibacterium sp. sgz301328 TaxID=3243764 RepID=UPI00359DEC63
MKRWVLPALVLGVLAWMISLPAEGLGGTGFWAIRREALLLTGIVAYLFMATAMVLALRLPWIERRLGGLDRNFGLHKWLGIAAGVLVIGHWLCEHGARWLVQAGWVERPSRGGARHGAEWFLSQFNGPAREIGEILLYVLIAMLIIALVRLVPYHWFRRLHKVFPVLFLAATFHSVVLMPPVLWPTVIGVLTAIAAVAGTIAAVLSLAGRIGRSRAHGGVVTEVRRLDDEVIELHCTLEGTGMAHRPGQFAFVTLDGLRDPHPFTMSSSGHDPNTVSFVVKTLGDDTQRMMQQLQVGTRASIEGPYGAFDFREEEQGQIWVGAGIGVTPFLARLEHLAAHPARAPRSIHFFCCAPATSPLAERIRSLCQRAGVTLHWIDQARDGSLDMQRIERVVGHNTRNSMWFCGPGAFGKLLARGWARLGRRSGDFHWERFAMR